MTGFINISLNVVNFLLPFLIGSLIFFSIIVAPNTFLNLDQKNARKFIRSIFPKLYLWAFLISLIASLLIAFYKVSFGLTIFIVSLGFLFSRQFLVKWINRVSDIKLKSKKEKTQFERLHSLSVFIFIIQIITLILIYSFI